MLQMRPASMADYSAIVDTIMMLTKQWQNSPSQQSITILNDPNK
jgi:hypothetical protein